VNFYISSENAKNLDISATVRLISTKFGMMIQNVFQVRRPLKNHFKNPRWRTADALERPFLHNHEILQFVDFQDNGCPSSSNFEIEIFNSHALQRHVLCYLVQFCGDRRDIAFSCFSSEM